VDEADAPAAGAAAAASEDEPLPTSDLADDDEGLVEDDLGNTTAAPAETEEKGETSNVFMALKVFLFLLAQLQ